MSDPFIGEIRMFAGNFAPRNWAYCNGTLLAVSQYNALFSLLGTTYGGDGRTTFALPDMQGRAPIHQGLGPGLSNRRLGSKFGEERVTLNSNEIPSHTHSLNASTDIASASDPANDVLGSQNDGDLPYASAPAEPSNLQNLNSQTLGNSGESQSHYNIMPYLAVSFIIALQGIYPSRS